ncbi:hypothetical protein ABZ027_42155 [Streptomyces sp. NPDC006332]|uniref:hypothetical protein n=1 Tax=Streptomyces sp. NPDC006332 TaxID=3155456 RepID=UPI0033AD5278
MTWAHPGYSNSGNSYVNAGRASFASHGDAFGIHDDAKDGFGLVLEVHATKANGTALDGAHYYYRGGGTADRNFLVKDLEEGSEVKFRLCMENNGGDTEFACGDWSHTPA